MAMLTDRRRAVAGLGTVLVALVSRTEPSRAEAAEPLALTAAPTSAVLVAGAPPSDVWTLGDGAAGPVLRVRHGQDLRATLRNATGAPLSLHWQGVRGASATDGVGGFTRPSVTPGASADLRIAPPDPGLFLIRPLVLGGASEPAARGVGGLLVVDEPNPPPVEADIALLVRDWLLQPSGEVAPLPPLEDAALGRLGNRITAGGEDAPKRVALPPKARVRLRLANGSNARAMRLRFEGLKVRVAAVDSQPTETFEPLGGALPFMPGARFELFVDLGREPGRTGRVLAEVGPGVPLIEFTTTAAEPAPDRPVPTLAPNRKLPVDIPLQRAVRRDVAITGGPPAGGGTPADPRRPWQINGAAGSPAGPPLVSVKRGQPVVLALRNTTAVLQVLHIHGHCVRVLHGLEDGWEPWWFDTVPVAEGKTVRIAFVADNPGRWLLGSAILERLDLGLWTWFEVT